MAKWSGKIGFAEQFEDKPGSWKERIVERQYKGDLQQNFIRNQAINQVLDDLNITNKISIVADLHASNNIPMMRYVTYKGAMWKITNVEIMPPRLILSVGGLYNG